VQHGNEDTFKEMLRIKRSVQVKFNTDVSYITAQMLQTQEKSKAAGGDAMQTLDRMTTGGPGEMTFVKYVSLFTSMFILIFEIMQLARGE
jgi:pre-mRNA-splicing factor SYF1